MSDISTPSLGSSAQHWGDYGSASSSSSNETRTSHQVSSAESSWATSSLTGLLGEFGFSPELVLYMANKRMSDIDGQVRTSMKELDSAYSQSEKVGKTIQVLRKLEENMEGKGSIRSTDYIETPQGSMSVEDYCNLNGVDFETDIVGKWVKLEQRISKEDENGERKIITHAFEISGKSIESAIDGFEEKQKEINTGNELRMVKLQSLMQQRTQILTLATNLLQKLDEGTQSIVRNLA